MAKSLIPQVDLYAVLLGAKKMVPITEAEKVQAVMDDEAVDFKDFALYDNKKQYSFQWDDASIAPVSDQYKDSSKKKSINNHLKVLQEYFLVFTLPTTNSKCLAPLYYDAHSIKKSDLQTRQAVAFALYQHQYAFEMTYPWEIRHPLLDSYYSLGIDKQLHTALEHNDILHVMTTENTLMDIKPVGIVTGKENQPMILTVDAKKIPFDKIQKVSLKPNSNMIMFGSQTSQENLKFGLHVNSLYLSTTESENAILSVLDKQQNIFGYYEMVFGTSGLRKESYEKIENCNELIQTDVKIAQIVLRADLFTQLIKTLKSVNPSKYNSFSGKTVLLKGENEYNVFREFLLNNTSNSKDLYKTKKMIKELDSPKRKFIAATDENELDGLQEELLGNFMRV